MKYLGVVIVRKTADGGFEAESYVGLYGEGRTSEGAVQDLEETARDVWEEFSQTPAGKLSNDSLSLFMEMRTYERDTSSPRPA